MLIPELCRDTSGLTLVRFRVPTLELAQAVQPIGYAAWREQLSGTRSDAEIRHVFDPDNSHDNAEALLERMRSKVGLFVGVIALFEGQEIGFAFAADDVGNMSRPAQHAKRVAGRLAGKKPFVWTAHLNVHPDFQGQGVGTAMHQEVYTPFGKDRRRTAYVFDENARAVNWFKKRGYEARPDRPVDPNPDSSGPDLYFGEGAGHVGQWRLEAPPPETVSEHEPPYRLPAYTTFDINT